MANFDDYQANLNPNSEDVTATSARLPWNNQIFPGNYVAKLNSWRTQCVEAFPGINFFRLVGVVEVTNTLAVGNHDLTVYSPDLRPDDKPRADKSPMTIVCDSSAAVARVYRVGISTHNLLGNSSTITTNPARPSNITQITLTSASTANGGAFLKGGEVTDFEFETNLNPINTDTNIGITVGTAALTREDTNRPGYVLVEVCYYQNMLGPDMDDVYPPFPLEAGQSTQ